MQTECKYPGLIGLVLAGGKSKRMQEDKGLIKYHGKAQREHCFELLMKLGLEKVLTSCRKDQMEELKDYFPIADKEGRAGPMFILDHVMELYPAKGFLVFPCDVPLMDIASFEYLLEQRDSSKIATAFLSPFDGKPEPLLAIWEAESHALIREHIAHDNISPRRLLMVEDARLVEAPSPEKLQNANTPEEQARIRAYIQQRKN
ncbi:MAG: NTP transferase domain-containing protein [Bacteroidia bacterium]|nr:NTP transferase domain-containing protein [Bacteroidia bacterium]